MEEKMKSWKKWMMECDAGKARPAEARKLVEMSVEERGGERVGQGEGQRKRTEGDEDGGSGGS